MYFKEWLVVYFTLIGSVLNENIYKNYQENSNGGNTKEEVVLHDMYMAFSPVTAHNTTNYIESVIGHMYNVQSNNNNLYRKSAMIFKLPYSRKSPYHDKNYLKQHQNAERVVLMERQQFMQPTFPNLTKSYMALRRFKFSHEPINSNITELMAKEINDIYGNANDHYWSDLGLSGWNGDIAGSSISPDHLNSNKLSTSTATNYPLIEITKGLTRGAASKSEYFQQVAANALMEKNDRVALMKELDINVFIARANDPFGYSTKWQMKQSNKTKSKRDVLRLYSMIKCSTGCEPLVYKGYGCYCGFLGHGVPADGIDRCCKLHDKCYGKSNCISYLEYFVPYVWKCYRGKPLCAIDHGEWGGPDSCAARLCYCDLRLSRCLRQYTCPERRAVCRSSVARRLQNILLVQ